MRKLALILTILLTSTICFSQQDTTIFFTQETETKYEPEVLRESEFKTIDIINFDSSQDSLTWTNSKWITKDSIHVNAKTYKLKQIQFRINEQGIKQRKQRTLRYSRVTKTRRRIRN